MHHPHEPVTRSHLRGPSLLVSPGGPQQGMSHANPDRASRSAGKRKADTTTDAAIVVRNEDSDSDSDSEPPTAALSSVPSTALSVPRSQTASSTVALASKQMTLGPARSTGVNSVTVPLKRHATAQRQHPAWGFVRILQEHEKNPTVQCMCGATFNGGASRITDHVLGRGGMKPCTGSGAEYDVLKQKLKKLDEEKAINKQQKQLVAASNSAAASGKLVSSGSGQSAQTSAVAPVVKGQTRLNFTSGTAPRVDMAIAKFFFGCNIPVRASRSDACSHKSPGPNRTR